MTAPTTPSNTRAKGFTLVELLIAIFILGLVLTTVYASYSGTMKISRQMEEEGNIYKMARICLDRMVKDLSSLQASAGAYDFHAERKTLRNNDFYFLSFWSASHLAFGENEAEGSPATIRYDVRENEDQKSFSLWRSDIPGARPSKEKNVEGGFMICRNVDSWNLKFYNAEGKELDSWDSSSSTDQKDKAPVAVHIELTLANLNDPEKPYKFMTKVFLPASKMEDHEKKQVESKNVAAQQ